MDTGDLVASSPALITVLSSAPITNAFELLSTHHLQSLAVIQTPESPPHAVVDGMDVLTVIVHSVAARTALADPRFTVARFLELVEALGAHRPVFSRCTILRHTDDSAIALKLLSSGLKRVYIRVPYKAPACTLSWFKNETRVLHKPLAQSDFIRRLANDKRVSGALHVSVRELVDELCNYPCVLDDSATVLEALCEMDHHSAESVAVVSDGVIQDTLSPSDILAILPNDAYRLDDILCMTIRQLLNLLYGNTIRSPITVFATDTVDRCFQLCALHKVHRVWVVDSNMAPEAVIRLEDLLQFISSSLHGRSPWRNASKVFSPTTLVSKASFRKLARVIPERFFSTSELTRVYSTTTDGYALSSVYRALEGSQACLLVISDMQDHIFGAFVGSPLQKSSVWIGNGLSFVFQLKPIFKVYRWTQDNSFFVVPRSGYLAVGGGSNHALLIDHTLRYGTSDTSETFGNPPLAFSKRFTLSNMEVWAFA